MKWVKSTYKKIKEMINWIKNKKSIEEQIKIDTHEIDLLRTEISKLKKKLEDKK